MKILDNIKKIYPAEEAQLIIKAHDFAKAAHKGQKRASGEEYFIHPCAVSQILVDLGMDCGTICAAFLHDTIEDTAVQEDDILREFGAEILQLVNGVTKLDKIQFKSKKEEQAENFKKIFVSMANDIRVIIIKLADRLHNMRSLCFLSRERQSAIAHETLDIYAPLAGRLGISNIKCELEDLSLKYIDGDAYDYLLNNISNRLDEKQTFLNATVKELEELLKASNIKGEVFGRRKHFYSIYKKMKNQNKPLDQIYDILAVRVIVETVDECYEIFGKIHKKWAPIPGRIKDYIAIPKLNLYQSLHTTVVTDFGQIFEIQIRTFEMHRTAEYGIAAHWKYKENKADTSTFDKKLSWIREVLEWQPGVKSTEFVETLKGDIYNQEVLVFTPKGEVISLSSGATPIDYAYRIHSEVGNRCVGAKVNGKIVPLNASLVTGDVVEIITNKSAKGPSWDWLKIAQTPSARAKIKQFFKRTMAEEHIRIGKSMLENHAKTKGYSFAALFTNATFEKVSEKFNFNTPDEMYAAVGCGAVSPQQVVYKFIDIERKVKPVEEFIASKDALPKKNSHTGGDVQVKGVDGLLIRFAGCCSPVPGDPIIGFVSRGRGVTIHRADCPNMQKEDQDRILPAVWTGKAADNYVVSIKVTATEKAPLMAIVSSSCQSLGLFVLSFNGRIDMKNHYSHADMTVRLNKKDDLDKLTKKLFDNPEILDVYRNIG
ncbi:MAG: bifunctional (p)ppGpp synthetase/guanosine-3',5'-bis(diphosphate) 3'-pyrophosphohydrolase [Clostridia bacterium]|nr:bifunctional (p)ppGpp synthetase/guanosine-3',5'-bis(diphosphate) 3'-pyrophosphohydrolase [Clostridia bacterium]MBQ6883254.1 bifunctional (p)ppGpp synthetase/guanosine-3',5'-bis(diphosphate) 3'-pyrophosphohydrolase [Clostridia bacterium]